MVNAFVEFVKEYRKKNPSLSYKDAMVKASKIYKKKDGGDKKTSSSKKSVKKGGSIDESGVIMGGGLSKNERNKKIRRFKKLQASVDADIRDGRVNDEMVKAFKMLANELKGNSQTNMYAKALKRVEKKLSTKKFQKKQTTVKERQKDLQAIKEIQLDKKKIEKDEKDYKKAQTKLNRMKKRTAELIRRKKEEFKKGKITEQALANYIAKVKDEVEEEERKTEDLEKVLKALDDKITKDTAKLSPSSLTYPQFVKSYSKAKGLTYKQAQKEVKQQNLYKKSKVVISAPKPSKSSAGLSLVVSDLTQTTPKQTKPPLPPKPKPKPKQTPRQIKALDDFVNKYKGLTGDDLLLAAQGGKKVNKKQVSTAIRQAQNLLNLDADNPDVKLIKGELEQLEKDYLQILKERKQSAKPPVPPKPTTPTPPSTGGAPAQPKVKRVVVNPDVDDLGDIMVELSEIAGAVYDASIDSGRTPKEAYDDIISFYEDVKDKKSFVNITTGQKFDLSKIPDVDDYLDGEIQQSEEFRDDLGSSSESDSGGEGSAGEGFAGAGFFMGKKPKDIIRDKEGGSLSSRIMQHFGKGNLVKEVDAVDRIFTKVSNSAYKKPNRRPKELEGYTLQEDLSDEENVVYVNEEDKKVIVGFRGSKNFKDFKTDIELAVGGIRNTERYDTTLNLVKKVIEMYKGYKIEFTGHSLGGTLAIEMNLISPSKRAVVFNAGHTPLRRRATDDNDITYYTNKGDLVSGLGMKSYKNVKVLDKEHKNPLKAHSLRNFMEEDGEKQDYQGGAFDFLNDGLKAVKKVSAINKIKNNLMKLKNEKTNMQQKLMIAKELFEDADKVADGKLSDYLKSVAEKLIQRFS